MTSSPAQPESQVRLDPWTLAALVVVGIAALRLVASTDFWLHLACGRAIATGGPWADQLFSFTLPADLSWTNTSWLYDLILYATWSLGGGIAVSLLHAASVVLAVGLLAATASRRAAWRPGIPAAAALSIPLLAPVLGTGPFLLAMPLLAATVLVLDRRPFTGRSLALLAIIQLAWANIHVSFLLAPLLAIVFWTDRVLGKEDETDDDRRGLLLAAAGALVLVSMIHPSGPKALLVAVQSLTSGAGRIDADWISPFAGLFDGVPGRAARYGAIALAIGGCLLWKQRLPLALTTTGALGLFLLVRAPLLSDMAVALSFPFLALSATAVLSSVATRLPAAAIAPARAAACGLLLAVLAFLAWDHASQRYTTRIGSMSSFGAGVAADVTPARAVDQLLSRPDLPRPLLHLAGDGGHLAWSLPNQPTFADQRISLFAQDVYGAFVSGLLGNTESWKATMERWRPGSILLSASWPAAGAAIRNLMLDGAWGLAYMDGVSAVLVRRNAPGAAALLTDRALQADGLAAIQSASEAYAARLRDASAAGNPPRLIGAGHVFQSTGRFREGEAVYDLLTRGTPTMSLAWLNLGISRVQLGKTAEAIPPLEKASDMAPGNPLAWLWLSRARELQGDAEGAAAARARAQELDADLAASFFAANPPPAPR